uniref:YgiT-type zinc finger domain-containing protein n=1 Tax=Candidatus Kentrum sp. FW TaxID=2126338 RepID=A0A450T5Y7_9GAMM|nr:MAG: YgiT-type zinc finger domain-containing protein [Candidatus Kentron sp. FW]VFJ67484.1 MAG: YgiT-type zinc finger domain-containing protein [Candidatus Kentron sp. FW]
MKCSIQGCPGQLEVRRISHTLQRGAEILVFEHVPAEVCSVCGDTLLAPSTIRRLEKLLDPKPEPSRMVPVYEYGYA